MAQHQEIRLQQVVEARLLQIADYQRAYAWESKQLRDLWEDLDLMGSTGSHYSGTLVIRELINDQRPSEVMSDDGTTLTLCEVVDGQQRLTTCLLLIDRIRRSLLELDGNPAAASMASKARSLYGVVTIDGRHTPRLKLGAGLNDYWVDSVLGDHVFVGGPMVSGQSRLRDAALFFDDKVSRLVEGATAHDAFLRLKDLYGRVTSGLKFLVYEVGSSAEVGVIFETLNERGRPLTELEKTKNYLLYLARSIPNAGAEQLARQINKAWGEIFTNLAGEPRAMEDQLLRAHWLATVDPSPRSWNGIDSIKQRFDRQVYVPGTSRLVPEPAGAQPSTDSWQRLKDEVSTYVRTLRDCSYFQFEMFRPDAAFEAFSPAARHRVRSGSAALRRSGAVAPFRPLLFAARLRCGHDGDLYADLVELCETFSARVFVIEQWRSNTGRSSLYRLAHRLYNQGLGDEVKGQLQAKIWYYAPDHRIRRTFDDAQSWYARRGHKYFLYEYERSSIAAGAELPSFDTFTEPSGPQRTTEHILPQHADEPCWTAVFARDEHARYVHTLGNLVLTLDNSHYSNKCFEAKRGVPLLPGQEPVACYAQGKLQQERELAAHMTWTPEEIMERQRRLGEWALGRWPVAQPGSAQLDDEAVEEAVEDEDEDAA